jgi:hypothetical protein
VWVAELLRVSGGGVVRAAGGGVVWWCGLELEQASGWCPVGERW